MEKNNSYFSPITIKQASRRQEEKWDEALALFKNKQYEQIIPTLLQYVGIDPHSKKVDDDAYEIAHGSVTLAIKQTDDTLEIKCPFLDIADAKKIPLLRRLAEMRMHPLNLTNITLENGLVYFFFSSPLHLCEPYKVYGVLREICYFADSYDDELIEKFEAKHIQEPIVIHFPIALKEETFSNYQIIIDEGLQRFDHYMEKRDDNNAWYTLNITFKKIEFYAAPQAYLRSILEKSVDELFDRNVPFQNRLLNGKKNVEQLKDYSLEKFSKDLYQIETFIPHKYTGKKENIRENWESSYSDAQEMMAHAKFEDASNLMLSCFYNLFYYNLVSENISQTVTDAMAHASDVSWNQAAPILLNGMKAIMEDTIDGHDFGMDLSKVMGEQMQQSLAAMQQIMTNFKMD